MKKLTVLLALLMLLAVFPVSASAEESSYEQTLFDHSRLIEIDIQMDDDDWEQMLANHADQSYVPCDLLVNGELYEDVAIRPKGNSSRLLVANQGSIRFSWRIKFNKYEEDRTCDGLDVLILNNGFKDPGAMREALAYDMYEFLGADASLYNYAVVSHNGEYFGVYLALEGVHESFAERNYGEDYGKLYKPELSSTENSDGFIDPAAMPVTSAASGTDAQAAGSEEAAGASDENSAASQEQLLAAFVLNTSEEPEDDELAMGLNYMGDDLDVYHAIWDNAKFKSDEDDYARVVEAIKHINEGDIEDYMDVDNVLKFFAVQTFIYNHDGMTGDTPHNYYLYEEDGKLNLIPWDINEAFTISGASYFVNFPIDTPFRVDMSQRRVFAVLLENEEYLAQYHEYLRQLSEDYVLGGRFEETYERIRSQIDELVDTDPTSLYLFSTFDRFVESIRLGVELRAQGVLAQLNGEVPSTWEGQEAEPDKLLDVSGVDLSGFNASLEMKS